MAKKLFDFDAQLKLGVEAMDNQHIKLVDMINDVQTLLNEGRKDEARSYFVKTLSAYIVEHFSNEEQFLESIGYPSIIEHKRIHQNYRKSFQDLSPLIELKDDDAFREAISDTYKWIVGHIGKTDRKYAEFYLSKNK